MPLLARALPRQGRFTVYYVELTSVIEGYVTVSSLSRQLIIVSDLLLAIRSLSSMGVIFLNLVLYSHIFLFS